MKKKIGRETVTNFLRLEPNIIIEKIIKMKKWGQKVQNKCSKVKKGLK